MGNALTNAGGLDGVTGWSAIGGAAVSALESGYGAPGRAVLQALGTANGAIGLQSSQLPAAAGQVWEIYAGLQASLPGQQLLAQWIDAGGANVIASAPVPQVSQPIGIARRGLPSSFGRYYGRLIAPAGTGHLSLIAQATSAGIPGVVLLLKPYAAQAPADPRPTLWDPGSHNNPDLQLAAWPSALPPFQADAMAQPIANAKAWTGDQGIPVREDLYRALHFEYRPRMRLDIEGQDTLEQFFETQRDPFYVVRPDTDQLCVADWLADGAPKPVSISGPWTMVEVGLHLEVA